MNTEQNVYEVFVNLKPVSADWEDLLEYVYIAAEYGDDTWVYALESIMCEVMNRPESTPDDSFDTEFERAKNFARELASTS